MKRAARLLTFTVAAHGVRIRRELCTAACQAAFREHLGGDSPREPTNHH